MPVGRCFADSAAEPTSGLIGAVAVVDSGLEGAAAGPHSMRAYATTQLLATHQLRSPARALRYEIDVDIHQFESLTVVGALPHHVAKGDIVMWTELAGVDCFTFTCGGGQVRPGQAGTAVLTATVDAAGTPIPPGDVTITVFVSATTHLVGWRPPGVDPSELGAGAPTQGHLERMIIGRVYPVLARVTSA